MFEEAMPIKEAQPEGMPPAAVPEQRPKKKKKKKKLKGKAAKKAMPQAERLEKARKWLASYDGDNVLKAYRKKFATDRMQALAELQLLGLTFTDEQIAAEKRAVQAYAQQQRAKKLKRRAKRRAAKRQAELQNPDQNDYFYFIAGYTSGGAPYGVTWEQMGLSPWEQPDDLN